MSPFPDTSFLCALYREQDNSKRADRKFNLLREPLPVSSLLLLEFRQSVRLQIGLHDRDKTRGFSRTEGTRMLEVLKSDLDSGVLKTVSVEWVAVHAIAERLSDECTISGCHRLTDILHVATSLHLGAGEFLTFDANQKRLARAAGLKAPL
ncbi:MAG TPA: PIN domain-containing protein [Candidatus Methylacidiphilales bacterium]|jgi:predicted nucleic acid-binding protein|nr:PIN domain-containing protein [Candidatus Methylacidiphilales bacterium]